MRRCRRLPRRCARRRSSCRMSAGRPSRKTSSGDLPARCTPSTTRPGSLKRRVRGVISTQPGDARAMQLCAEAMQRATAIACEVATLPDGHTQSVRLTAKREAPATPDAGPDGPAMAAEQTLGQLQHCAKALEELRRAHRSETLGAVANGTLTAGEAVARVEAVRILEALAHHAWRSSAHLIGRADLRPRGSLPMSALSQKRT
jgi:hypothetical protein